MKNGKRVFIGDNSYEFGRILSDYLTANDFEVTCRRNEAALLKNEIISASPDVCVICISDSADPSLKLISELSDSECSTKILAAVFSTSQELCRKAIETGAERCILMPSAMRQLLNIISELSHMPTLSPLEAEVTTFLTEYGFPTHLKGFSFLATAICICITNPDCLSDITNNLYSRLAEIHNTTPLTIERAIRHVAQLAHENGSDLLISGENCYSLPLPDSPLTNTELICAASDAFAVKYNLY